MSTAYAAKNLKNAPGTIKCTLFPVGINQTSASTVKTKLYEKYGDGVYVSCIQSEDRVICHRRTGDGILNQHWYENRKLDPEQERLRIVQTAAKIVLEDIRSKAYTTLLSILPALNS